MWLIALKGVAGTGKSTLGRALSKQLGWPLIDKDDIKDLLVDTVRPPQECLIGILRWLEQIFPPYRQQA